MTPVLDTSKAIPTPITCQQPHSMPMSDRMDHAAHGGGASLEPVRPLAYVCPFSHAEYAHRVQRIRDAMGRRHIDVALISDPKSVWWLAAGKAKFEYADNPIWLLVTRDGTAPVTAIVRYLERDTFARSMSPIVEDILTYKDGGEMIPFDPIPVVAACLAKRTETAFTLGVAWRYFNVLDYFRLREQVPQAQCVAFPLEQVRALKSSQELAMMRVAASVNAQALYQTLCELRIGHTEWDFAQRVRELHRSLLGPDYGGSSDSAQTAQFGPHAHDMHPKRLAAEMQTMASTANMAGNVEPGVFINSYVGCMMRPLFFGDPVPAIIPDAIAASAEGLMNAFKMMGPGVPSSAVDEVIRTSMTRTGLDVRSRTGYGCGIEWDEGNTVSFAPGNAAALQVGHTLHVIAHTYGPYGFLGLSEQIAVTPTGCEVLAGLNGPCPRQLFVVR